MRLSQPFSLRIGYPRQQKGPALTVAGMLNRRRNRKAVTVMVFRIANRANRAKGGDFAKGGDSRRIARRSIKSRIAPIVI